MFSKHVYFWKFSANFIYFQISYITVHSGIFGNIQNGLNPMSFNAPGRPRRKCNTNGRNRSGETFVIIRMSFSSDIIPKQRKSLPDQVLMNFIKKHYMSSEHTPNNAEFLLGNKYMKIPFHFTNYSPS